VGYLFRDLEGWAVTDYKYPVSATANSSAIPSALALEIEYSGLSAESIIVRDGYITISFAEPLQPEQKVVLDYVVSNHQGVKYPSIEILASQTLVDGVLEVKNNMEWQVIGSQLLRPTKIHPDLPSLVSQVFGEASITGDGAELKIVECRQDGSEVDITNPDIVLTSTGGVWQPIDIFSNTQLSDGFNRYEIRARKNGAKSFLLRYISGALIRVH
jgi:hypothetical protein